MFLSKNVAVLICFYHHEIVLVTAEGHIKREHTHLKPNFGMGRMLMLTELQGQERKQDNHSSLKSWCCVLLYLSFHS
uniref:Putative secreted protein n=1 Tax=Ixodes ricinus TaxID=34613 RepID=A0A6B0U4F4_IXORI